ncbi:DNA-nicking Smr family endonuclease [Rhodovulum imhoffii]|uniref:DNA-nicking Smr family endonuclease n=1 Tax=Rhodovulum imhoffii TaxID=365340 RepID=A0A2T5BRL5_9RHOB|nr:Smr/MutS family protein [Rhodovulum imhoffii]MBK5934043.1 hypothetical protein [Rhodovulum imhoffii]PTN01928.1 DNA-nicking Smr family endonuclease [Rhodovulum imhoffii]
MSRRLTPEDYALWQEVAATARPMHPERPAPSSGKGVRPRPAKHAPRSVRPTGQSGRSRVSGHDLAPTLSESLAQSPVRMDRKTHDRMRRGNLAPESRIDLHGKTLVQAHPDLTEFIRRAHGQGKRLVLVITGKGRTGPEDGPVPQRRGALRHQVPLWLSSGPLAGLVLHITPAHRKHGGEGAFYVYLRRYRA